MLTSALCASVHHVCHHLWHHFWWLLSYADICCLSPCATGLAVGVQHIQFKCHSECGSDNDSHNGRTGQSCQHASSLQGCSQQTVTAYSFETKFSLSKLSNVASSHMLLQVYMESLEISVKTSGNIWAA